MNKWTWAEARRGTSHTGTPKFLWTAARTSAAKWTWTGAGNASSWTDPKNWSPAGPPQPFAPVDIRPVAGAPVSVTIAAGVVVAAGQLTLGRAGASAHVTLTNDGTFVDSSRVTVLQDASLANAGTMILADETILGAQTNRGLESISGNVRIAASGTFDTGIGGASTIYGAIRIDGALDAEGNVQVQAGLRGHGTVNVDGGTLGGAAGAALDVGKAALAFNLAQGGEVDVAKPSSADSFTFGAPTAGKYTVLSLHTHGTVASAIDHFGVGDAIVTGSSGTTSVTANGTDYTIVYGSVTLAHVSLSPGVIPSEIHFNSGTITVACYRAGTRIETDRGETPVEDLRQGDQVATASGHLRPVTWIGTRRYEAIETAGTPDLRPVLIRAGALGDGLPRRDLEVSPRHCLFIDGVLVPAMHLVNGVSVLQPEHPGAVAYVHIELASHDVVRAEGALAETFRDDNSAGMFENAATRPASADAATTPCAPVIEDGFALEAIRARIDAIAGRRRGKTSAPGPLQGGIERIEPARITGWAQDLRHPDAPVCLTVHDGATLLGRVIANRPHSDAGPHGFELTLPTPRATGAITVRRESDGAILRGSPGAWLADLAA